MTSIKQMIIESVFGDPLNEALMTFGKSPYPKFGNILIMGGGAGSGKGFVLSNLVGLEGKVFDVDELKTLVMKSTKLASAIKSAYGVDVSKLNLKTPEDVAKLHEIVGDELSLPDKKLEAFVKSVLSASPDRKPNAIFDVTLKSMKHLNKYAQLAERLGYDKKNIHIVWTVNDIQVASAQNQARPRTVPEDILIDTHQGAATTVKQILSMGNELKRYMDGSIYLAFNRAEVGLGKGFDKLSLDNSGETDSSLAASGSRGAGSIFTSKKSKQRVGQYIKKANYVKVKESGKNVVSPDELAKEFVDKIRRYVPKGTF